MPYFPRRHLMLVTGVSILLLLLIGLVPSTDVEANRTRITLEIDAFKEEPPENDISRRTRPFLSKELNEAPEPDSEAIRLARKEAERQAKERAALGRWQSIVIASGDNLSSLFAQQGLGARVVYNISQTPDFGKQLANIRPGQTLEFRVNHNGELTQFRYVRDRLSSILFQQTADGYSAEEVILEPQIRTAYAEGEITNSLFLASQRAGLTDGLTMELAGIFGWDIDFALDIRSGDSFSVVYEERYLADDNGDQKLGNGNILAATFVNNGKDYTAIRYTDKNGNSSYYTPDGKSMRKAFLRTPVDFTRISSNFNPDRLHPVFKTKRPHRGVDYAAPTGTPIKAAGDGRISFAGWQNGFGNVVFIEHPNNIVTVYAHQSRLNKRLRKGSRVNQGDVIGYVGSTGWATGPHLHYEFRVNGVHRNPVTVKLPDAKPVPKSEMARFKQHKTGILAQLDHHQKAHQKTMLAAAQ
ncbi:peptidase M23 [Endozoicomonas montiporae]|uniref:Peptidase M23 n=1 Tax=Endozoicomonas montiporae TaxID=1027273 RepID=A0A081N8P5_9GAMM|nr:peptidase M23 [Endozoicomonas montiporae]